MLYVERERGEKSVIVRRLALFLRPLLDNEAERTEIHTSIQQVNYFPSSESYSSSNLSDFSSTSGAEERNCSWTYVEDPKLKKIREERETGKCEGTI